MQKNILYVSYYFPPHTGAGIQRPLRMVKKMAEDGLNIHLVSSDYLYVKTDESFQNEISKKIIVYYLKDSVNNFFYKYNLKFLSKIFTFISFPDRMLFWFILNRKKILHICKENDIDTIITSSFPYSSHLVGNYIKKTMPSVKWIVDYRDTWSNNPSIMYSKYKPLFWGFSKYLEKCINNNADKIMTVSEPLVDDIIVENHSKVSVIYNGYNENDFIYLQKKITKNYVIFFMGSLYAERNPELFIEPFIKFINTLNNEELQQLELRFIGNSHQNEIDTLKKRIKKINLVVSDYIPHDQVLCSAAEASLLLLIIDDIYGAEGVVTGKIFEYIKLFAPILAIVPINGIAAKIIQDTNTGFCFQPKDTENICDFLIKDFNLWKNDINREEFISSKNISKIKEFSSSNIYRNFKNKILT